MKKVLVFVLLLLITLFCFLFFNNDIKFKDSNKKEESINHVKQDVFDECENKDCGTYESKKYIFDINNEILVSNMYNYDTTQMDSGFLRIKDNKLVFESLDNKLIKTYDDLEGKIKNISAVSSNCDDVFYVVLTEDGKLYKTDANMLFVENPFYQVELDYKVKNIIIDSSSCNDIKVLALDESNNILLVD